MDTYKYSNSQDYRDGYIMGRFTTDWPESEDEINKLSLDKGMGLADGRLELNDLLEVEKNRKVFYEQLQAKCGQQVYVNVPCNYGVCGWVTIQGELSLGCNFTDFNFRVSDKAYGYIVFHSNSVTKIESTQEDGFVITVK